MRYTIDPGDVPPDGLWVSPEGEAFPVTEHVMSLKRDPERFGLSPRDVSSTSPPALAVVARKIIAEGWTRFRLFHDHWAFEVDSVRKRARLIDDILAAHGAAPGETVRVSQASPRKEFEGTVEEFFDRKMVREHDLAGRRRRKNTWRFT